MNHSKCMAMDVYHSGHHTGTIYHLMFAFADKSHEYIGTVKEIPKIRVVAESMNGLTEKARVAILEHIAPVSDGYVPVIIPEFVKSIHSANDKEQIYEVKCFGSAEYFNQYGFFICGYHYEKLDDIGKNSFRRIEAN